MGQELISRFARFAKNQIVTLARFALRGRV
jgi:hypothetical protein